MKYLFRLVSVFFFFAAFIFTVSCGQGKTVSSDPAAGIAGPVMQDPAGNQEGINAPVQEKDAFSATRGIEPVKVDWDNFRYLTASVSPALFNAAANTRWLLSMSFAGEGAEAEGIVRFRSSGGEEREFSLFLAPINQTLFFPFGAVGFVPEEITVEVSPPARLSGLFLEPGALDSSGGAGNIIPVPADPGIILTYDRKFWRQADYELFRYNLIPGILIFDFADYAAQRRFFARLAFFVGVTGESGRIEEESYYIGRHVFNAHDYRPEDMVEFYRKAEREGISLNPEEKLLKEISIKNGILRMEDGKIFPGSGAVLSVSREIPSYLQRRLLTHELMHGIFYALPEFREDNFHYYRSMSSEEKEFWYYFLGNKGNLDGRAGYAGYDVDNEYLLVNEILGHMMQLLPGEVNTYFMDVYMKRMEQLVPERASLYGVIRKEQPGIFINTRTRLENLLEKATGLRKGNVFIVR